MNSYLELGALPTAVPCARLHARHLLREWGLNGLADSGELLVSELVTNAVQATAGHPAHAPVRLRLSGDTARVLIEVWDADPRPPQPMVPDLEDEGGRGLFLVAALSTAWNWYPTEEPAGKVIWCELAGHPAPRPGPVRSLPASNGLLLTMVRTGKTGLVAVEETPDLETTRDADGHLRLVRHVAEPFTSARAGLETASARELAEQYVRQVRGLFGIEEQEIADLAGEIRGEPVDEGPRLRFGQEKQILSTTVVSFQQTYLGLPVWQSVLEVRLHGDPPAVGSSHSTLHYQIDATRPSAGSLASSGEADGSLRAALGLDEAAGELLRINSSRLLVYRYDPGDRTDPASVLEPGLAGGPPVLPLPPVPDTIRPGRHYVVREVLFSLPLPDWGDLNWRAFVEPETGAALYLRAFVASATACVFTTDPVSASGKALDGCSPAATLDPLRTTVPLAGLDQPDKLGVQSLTGEFVAVKDTDPPKVPPPTATDPFSFCYSAVTDGFAAASAYFHYDGAYRLVQRMGFKMAAYFDGTTFPVPVDHAGWGTSVAATAEGNTSGDGMGRFRSGLAASGCPVGVAADGRVALHESGPGRHDTSPT